MGPAYPPHPRYMDRTYVAQNKKTPVYDLGLIIFRDTVARHEQVRSNV